MTAASSQRVWHEYLTCRLIMQSAEGRDEKKKKKTNNEPTKKLHKISIEFPKLIYVIYLQHLGYIWNRYIIKNNAYILNNVKKKKNK